MNREGQRFESRRARQVYVISRIKILKSQEDYLGENTLLCRGFANYRHLLQSVILP
jgi:hypothetical protein